MRLYRPHVPLETRCRVALRQLGELWPDEAIAANAAGLGAFLDRLLKKLAELLDEDKLHLDHDPPLAARPQFKRGLDRKTYYEPDANDPDHLIYRGSHAHYIKTNVKGDGAQFPDRVLIARARRRDKVPARSGVLSNGKIGRGKARFGRTKQKIKGRSFQQMRCMIGVRCSCDQKKRKLCSNYQRSR